MPSSTGTGVTLTLADYKAFYTSAGGQSVTAADIVRILSAIIDTISSEEVSISDLSDALALLTLIVSSNTKEIEYQHRLNGLLILELLEQKIKIENKELLNELKYIK